MALFAWILFLLGDKMNRKAEKNMLSEEKKKPKKHLNKVSKEES